MAQLAGLLARPSLQLLIAEGLLGARLRGDHIGRIDGIARAAGQGQKRSQLKRLLQLGLEGGIAAGRHHKGIKLLQAHRGRVNWTRSSR